MERSERVVQGQDGEKIRVEEFGAPDGKPVLVHPGSPGSRLLFQPDAELAAREFGLHLLCFDRPGYGGRRPSPGHTIADVIPEVRLVADALGLDRFAVWGVSGGGAYALACAALLPELVTGAAVLASFAPYGSPGLDFCGSWPQELRDEVELFFADPVTARENWRQDTQRIFTACSTPEGWMTRWGKAACTDQARSLEVAEYLAADIREALADGDDGYWDDWAATLSPWGFDVAAIRVPVRLWHGERDRNVPVTNGHWLAAHIPGAIAEFPESYDHTNIEDTYKRAAYCWLASLA